jgi:hypothetical protein
VHTVARPLVTVAMDVATYVEAVPQALFARFLTTTRHTTQTVRTRRPRHQHHNAITPHAASPYVMLIESDITDTMPGVFS